MLRFSVVIPVKDEVDLIPRTLPSYYAVRPSEVLLCTDKPCPAEVRSTVMQVAEACGAHQITRIIEVEKDVEWKYHQAHVRRTGFDRANYHRILTGDIDLIINRNVLKAVGLVGENNIGLVSVSKFQYPNTLLRLLRLVGVGILLKYIHHLAQLYRGRGIETTTFTGLYSIWKPYWLDREPQEELKKLKSSKTPLRRGEKQWVGWDSNMILSAGEEDTFLRDHVREKHKVVYLPDIGGLVLTDPWEDRPVVQYRRGIYFCLRGRNLIGALTRTIFRLQPFYLCGHLYGRKLLKSPYFVKRLMNETI